MVDILRFPTPLPPSIPSTAHFLRYTKAYQQLTNPILLSNVHHIPQNNSIKNYNVKRWVGRCPCDAPRFLDVSDSPYSIHRKIMNQELSRQTIATLDFTGSSKNKQQRNANKEIPKLSTDPTGTTMASQPSFNSGDAQSTRLFDTLSKHVTIKPEPLRSTSSLVNNSTTTLTSWQRYWTSTHTQRRRKELNETEPVFYRPKCDQSTAGQTHFVVLRDSPYSNSEHHTDSRTVFTSPNPCPSSKVSVPTTTTTTKDYSIKKETNSVSLIELDASSLIPSADELNSSTVVSKASTNLPFFKSTDEDDGKSLIEKSSVMASSRFKSDSDYIGEVASAQFEMKPIPNKMFKLPLDPEKPKLTRSPPRRRRRTRSKSLEKKETRTPSASKRKRQASSGKTKQISTAMTTAPASKYCRARWDEPYVGVRFDPPTPPCSPSLFMWPQDDSDQDDNNAPFQNSELFEHDATTRALENCVL